MSYEGGVTPVDRTLDVLLRRVAPEAGEGALGTWRFPERAQTLNYRFGSGGTAMIIVAVF